MFEWRAPIFIKSLQTGYSTWDEDDYQFQIGSMSAVTEKILSAHQSSVRIRANPGSLNNDYLAFRTYAKYQTLLRIVLDADTMENAKKEVVDLIDEMQKILASPDWFLCYQIGCYWEFVSAENTASVDDVLQELWTKAAGDKDEPSFSYIKQGLQKVFKDAIGSARGGLYGSLVVDARKSISVDVGATPIVSSLHLKLDEFLCDEDIAIAANHLFRGYTEEAAENLFKVKHADRNMNSFF